MGGRRALRHASADETFIVRRTLGDSAYWVSGQVCDAAAVRDAILSVDGDMLWYTPSPFPIFSCFENWVLHTFPFPGLPRSAFWDVLNASPKASHSFSFSPSGRIIAEPVFRMSDKQEMRGLGASVQCLASHRSLRQSL